MIFFVINKETRDYNNHVKQDISLNFSHCISEVWNHHVKYFKFFLYKLPQNLLISWERLVKRMPAPPKKFSSSVTGVCHSTALDEYFQTVNEYEVNEMEWTLIHRQ
jgi:hypothetical protein